MNRLCAVVALVALAASLAACVNQATVSKNEFDLTYGEFKCKDGKKQCSYANAVDFTTISGNINIAGQLAESYLKSADSAAHHQDVAATGVIGAAATAAGGLLYGGNLSLIRGAGLAAGTIGALDGYYDQGEVSRALINAANQMACIASVGSQASTKNKSAVPDDDADAADVLRLAILKVRVNLRSAMARQMPEFSSVIEEIKNSSVERQVRQANERDANGVMSNAPSKELILAALREDVSKCIASTL